MKDKTIKFVGLGLTIGGAALSIASALLGEVKTDRALTAKVDAKDEYIKELVKNEVANQMKK